MLYSCTVQDILNVHRFVVAAIRCLWKILLIFLEWYGRWHDFQTRQRLKYPRLYENGFFVSTVTATAIALANRFTIFDDIINDIAGLFVICLAVGELCLSYHHKYRLLSGNIRVIQFIAIGILVTNASYRVHCALNHPDTVDLDTDPQDLIKSNPVDLEVEAIQLRTVLRLDNYSCGIYSSIFSEEKLSSLLGYGQAFKKTTVIVLLSYLLRLLIGKEDISAVYLSTLIYFVASTVLLYGMLTEKRGLWYTALFGERLINDIYFFGKQQSEFLLFPFVKDYSIAIVAFNTFLVYETLLKLACVRAFIHHICCIRRLKDMGLLQLVRREYRIRYVYVPSYEDRERHVVIKYIVDGLREMVLDKELLV
ncbi:hypothetical protein QR680_007860 [Steinernema hermaphroditum]|uniref:Uncharacterized protein n=1 Tax=Steinernema hermaphroditum TaxID=289476 RepID=A0AA39IGP1_9BILA|nr:hypothetical protein QR680_007860 [Steinernema hermaphroditum]